MFECDAIPSKSAVLCTCTQFLSLFFLVFSFSKKQVPGSRVAPSAAMSYLVLLLISALLASLPICSTQQQQQQQQQDDPFVGLNADGQLLFSDADESLTLRALVAQLSTLVAGQSAMQAGLSTVVAGQTALLNKVCILSRTSIFQSVPTMGATMWEYFTMGGASYLAVANYQSSATNFSVNSEILRFDGSSFVLFQSIPTEGAIDWEFFNINDQSYLAVANHQKRGNSYSINSEILRFDGSSFVLFQSIPTQGAIDWEFFTMGGTSYLAVANSQSTGTDFAIDSQILMFNGSTFVHFQSIPTQGAIDWPWEFFTIDSQSYLAVVNHYSANSQILRFDGSFTCCQHRAHTIFSTSNQSYLAVANAFDGSRYSINSQILSFNGSSFLPFLSFPTVGAMYWEWLNMGGQSYLAIANSNNGSNWLLNSHILRLSDPCFGSNWLLNSHILRLSDPCFQ
jgi:hypothetical protein